MKPSEILEVYGDYVLLDRIGSGGMAEIFRARPADPAAFGRIVVLKRILPHVAGEPDFIRMFRSEIQLSMAFHHPNTVQIHDFQILGGQPFLAMEYVHGQNLKSIHHRFVEKGRTLPVSAAAYIVEKAARGLHYAHTFENSSTGEKLRLVHRDVSPQNILVSYKGEVKIIDFGIAKATLKSSEFTRPGTIKGKLSYLSPEQVEGKALDARSDIFSLGIVLWELLTGRKLFSGNSQQSELDTIQLIVGFESIERPSKINPSVPPVLDRITMLALRKRPSDRYASAEEMARVLRTFLAAYAPGYGEDQLGEQMSEEFFEEIAADSVALKELNERSQKLLTEGKLKLRGSRGASSSGKTSTTLIVRRKTVFSRWGGPVLRVVREAGLALGLNGPRVAIAAAFVLVLAGWFLDSKYLIAQKLMLSDVQVYREAMLDHPQAPTLAPAAVKPIVIVQRPVIIREEPKPEAAPREEPAHPDLADFGTHPVAHRHSVILRVELIPPPKKGENISIRINHLAVGIDHPWAAVPLNQRVDVRVERERYRSYSETFILRSKKFGQVDRAVVQVRSRRLVDARAHHRRLALDRVR